MVITKSAYLLALERRCSSEFFLLRLGVIIDAAPIPRGSLKLALLQERISMVLSIAMVLSMGDGRPGLAYRIFAYVALLLDDPDGDEMVCCDIDRECRPIWLFCASCIIDALVRL